MTTAEAIRRVCAELADFLVAKNESYGDSVAEPMRVFSRAAPLEQIAVRVDDKLARLARAPGSPLAVQEDTVTDLLGYLVLYKAIALKTTDETLVSPP